MALARARSGSRGETTGEPDAPDGLESVGGITAEGALFCWGDAGDPPVDRCFEARDPEGMRQALEAVTTLAATSPFRDLVTLEATRAALRQDKNWEI